MLLIIIDVVNNNSISTIYLIETFVSESVSSVLVSVSTKAHTPDTTPVSVLHMRLYRTQNDEFIWCITLRAGHICNKTMNTGF